MLLIVPKLSESVKNTQLLKYLSKCQMDEQVWKTGFKGIYVIIIHAGFIQDFWPRVEIGLGGDKSGRGYPSV